MWQVEGFVKHRSTEEEQEELISCRKRERQVLEYSLVSSKVALQ